MSFNSSTNPKIANYHFTTLKPNLGVVKMPSGETFVLADIPGLIEGASQGIGLGHEFLRHIERTRLLLHVIDISGQEGRNPIEDFLMINEELRTYSEKLAGKKQIIVLNKIDLPGVEDNIKLVRSELGDKYQIFEISAATSSGIREVLYAALEMMKSIPPEETLYDASEVVKLHNVVKKDTINVYKRNEIYVADGYFLDVLVESTNFEDTESIRNFQKVLNDKGVVDRLRELGASEGDSVEICGIEFDFIE
ncbi:MAG: Obg family GTPase CgtA [Dethiosulfatibacter sp.]|nr:Obg family GTPase CgtA [Dethiosulfatibacter sp.]